MARRIRVRAIKRRELDEDKLALAFLMLAKAMREHEESDRPEGDDSADEREAS